MVKFTHRSLYPFNRILGAPYSQCGRRGRWNSFFPLGFRTADLPGRNPVTLPLWNPIGAHKTSLRVPPKILERKQIKIFKHYLEFQIYLNPLRGYFYGNWEYVILSSLYQIPLFCFVFIYSAPSEYKYHYRCSSKENILGKTAPCHVGSRGSRLYQ